MSSNESTSSDQEHIDAEELNQDEGQSASTSRELMPTNSRELTSSQDVSGGQFGERIITGEVALPGMGAGTTMTGPVENKIDGGDFYGATLGPVTHRNKIITHHEQKSTHIGKIEHIHYHGSNRSDELLRSETQDNQDVLMLTGRIKLFTNQKLHKTKLIYKGEKTTAAEPIPVVVKLMNYSKEALREAESLHSIDNQPHPNVVRIYDSGAHYTDIKHIFIAMELCSHETLFSYINQNVNFNLQQAMKYSAQIISGLDYIHSQKILHRDLKPDNILFSLTDGYNQVKITDFGMSKNYVTDPNATSQAFGTEGYVAPEIVKRQKPEDPTKCDIFSLGVLLVFILSKGKHPYGDEPWEWNYNIARGRDPNLMSILLPNGNQKKAVLFIIRKMLLNDPRNRPTAANVLKNWLKDVGDQLEEQQPESSGQHIVPFSQRFSAVIGKGHQDSRPKITQSPGPSQGQKRSHETPIKQIKDSAGNDAFSYRRKLRRVEDSETIHIPCIIGVTMRNKELNQGHKLIHWKSLEDLMYDPTIIFETPSDVCNFSVISVGHRITLVRQDSLCYEFDLDNRTEGLKGLDSMKHDHGLWPPGTVMNGKVYACGRWKLLGETLSKKCEALTDRWSDIPDMIEARNGNCIVSFRGCLFSIGGRDKEGNPMNSVEKYDPKSGEWELFHQLNVARSVPRAVAYDGKMYVLGGFDRNQVWLASFECFDPSKSSWTLSPSSWLKTNILYFPFVFDNKVLSVLYVDASGFRTIGQVPLNNEDEGDLVRVELPERWKLYNIVAVE